MKNYKEIFLGIATLLFAISGTLSFMAQSESDSAIENAFYFRNGHDALQVDTNTVSILRSLCDGLENNLTACYESKQQSINYWGDLSEKLKEYSKKYDENSKKSKNKEKLALIIFYLGGIFSIMYIIATFTQKD